MSSAPLVRFPSNFSKNVWFIPSSVIPLSTFVPSLILFTYPPAKSAKYSLPPLLEFQHFCYWHIIMVIQDM